MDRLFRLLLDPAPVEGGGTPPATPPAPAPAPTPPPAPPAPATVSLPAEEAQRLYAGLRQLEEFQAAQATTLAAAEAQRLAAVAAKDGAETALAQQRTAWEQRLAGLETSLLGDRQQAVVATAVAGVKFATPEAAKHALAILGSGIESVRNPADNSILVRDKATGRPAADVIREALASPGYAHFLAPASSGGAGAKGGDLPPAATEPKTVADALLAHAKQQLAGNTGNPYSPVRRG